MDWGKKRDSTKTQTLAPQRSLEIIRDGITTGANKKPPKISTSENELFMSKQQLLNNILSGQNNALSQQTQQTQQTQHNNGWNKTSI